MEIRTYIVKDKGKNPGWFPFILMEGKFHFVLLCPSGNERELLSLIEYKQAILCCPLLGYEVIVQILF
jgi:hypothetical protein